MSSNKKDTLPKEIDIFLYWRHQYVQFTQMPMLQSFEQTTAMTKRWKPQQTASTWSAQMSPLLQQLRSSPRWMSLVSTRFRKEHPLYKRRANSPQHRRRVKQQNTYLPDLRVDGPFLKKLSWGLKRFIAVQTSFIPQATAKTTLRTLRDWKYNEKRIGNQLDDRFDRVLRFLRTTTVSLWIKMSKIFTMFFICRTHWSAPTVFSDFANTSQQYLPQRTSSAKADSKNSDKEAEKTNTIEPKRMLKNQHQLTNSKPWLINWLAMSSILISRAKPMLTWQATSRDHGI